jgi:hypothetical protein
MPYKLQTEADPLIDAVQRLFGQHGILAKNGQRRCGLSQPSGEGIEARRRRVALQFALNAGDLKFKR